MRNKGYGFGALISIDMVTDEKANLLMDKLENKYHFGFVAVSLGYYENLMSASGSSTSSEMDPETMKRLGITPGLIIRYFGPEMEPIQKRIRRNEGVICARKILHCTV
jgi:methionine-gamma-lyase